MKKEIENGRKKQIKERCSERDKKTEKTRDRAREIEGQTDWEIERWGKTELKWYTEVEE